MLSALTIHDVPIECINQAAITYNIPAKLIITVLSMEKGRIGSAIANKNGSYDYGPMQINSIWLKTIERYGYTKKQIQYDPCVNVMVGAWILSTRIANSQDLWEGIGSYHSFTPDLNRRYRVKAADIYQTLTDYLSYS
jgi:soluble lytic murein transglycosylase-like protein